MYSRHVRDRGPALAAVVAHREEDAAPEEPARIGPACERRKIEAAGSCRNGGDVTDARHEVPERQQPPAKPTKHRLRTLEIGKMTAERPPQHLQPDHAADHVAERDARQTSRAGGNEGGPRVQNS